MAKKKEIDIDILYGLFFFSVSGLLDEVLVNQ